MSHGNWAQILADYGLTPTETERNDVRILASRIVESEAALKRLQEQVAQAARQASNGVLADGHILFAAGGNPLSSMVDLAVSIDLELVRLDERRTALRVVADAIASSR